MSTVTVDTHLIHALRSADRLSKLDPNDLYACLKIICEQGYLRAVLPQLIEELESGDSPETQRAKP